jgi:GGDEF domain-containing protein
MRITTEMIMAKKPCADYTTERVHGLIGDGKSLLEILAGDIPAEDRIWVIAQFLSDLENRKFAIWCARRVNRNNIPEITAYIDAIEAYYITGSGTEDQMRAADRAAYRAADGAAERKAQIEYLRDAIGKGE